MNDYEILELLRKAYDCFQASDLDGYNARLTAAKSEIDAVGERGPLYGELVLVSSLIDIYNLDVQCEKMREALQYIGGCSRAFPTCAELFGKYFHPFGICNRLPGCADKNAEKVSEAVQLFFALTGGGKGVDLCYQAQLAFYRGELTKARRLAMKAFETARQYEQELCALCAADVLAQTAKHTCNKKLWHFAYSYIQSIADEARPVERHCREIAQMLYATLNLSLGLIRAMPEWIASGDFGAISAPWGYRIVGDKICAGTLPTALFTQIQYHLYRGDTCGDPIKPLNIADAAQKIYGIDNLITGIYYDFFRAMCYFMLDGEGDQARAVASLTHAMEQLAPDGLYLIVAEFAPGLGNFAYEIAAKIDPDAPAKIRALGENYWDKLTPFREDEIRNAPQGFTKREGQIAVLISAGKTTREIAAELCISERTVENHASHIFTKLNVTRKAHVAAALKTYQSIETAFWVR